jgi:site-specific DNA-methyltransferase (adenine-specific)
MSNLINEIHNCDNREILKQMPDKSIQVFLEDMPYGTTACKWDTRPDLKEYWDLRLSKIKDNGCFVLFGSEPFSSYLRMSNIKMYKYDWVWEKSRMVNFFQSSFKPMGVHETISIFYNHIPVFNPIKWEINERFIDRRKTFNIYEETGQFKGNKKIHKIDDGTRNPCTIISFNSVNTEIENHPTQKPVPLFEYLIKTYSNENDLIFDGFSGSGTTAIASYNTKRNFICCELDKTYYDKSIIRLNEVKNNLFEANYV